MRNICILLLINRDSFDTYMYADPFESEEAVRQCLSD